MKPSSVVSVYCVRLIVHVLPWLTRGRSGCRGGAVGDLTVTSNRLELAADPGQALTIWTAKPRSESAEALSLSEAGPRHLKSQNYTMPQTAPHSAPQAPAQTIRCELPGSRTASLVAGSQSSGYDPPEELIEDARRIVAAAGMELGGVEYLVNERDGLP
jgi:hypothetical protein